MPLLDAVVLSLFLTGSRRRAALFACCAPRDESDQRRTPSLGRLAACLQSRPVTLEPEIRAAGEQAARLLATAERCGIDAIGWRDARYPSRLAAIEDPPAVLWIRGDPAALVGPAVAVVGSRAGSTYACTVAEQLGSELSRRGVRVVSGLARGVDSAAHRGALAASGRTLAVLGSGVDVVYPPEHARLHRRSPPEGAC